MGRLTKEQLGDRGRYRFKQEEIELEELATEEELENGDIPTVLVRTPSVGQRDALVKRLPDNPDEYDDEATAAMVACFVVDPVIDPEEAKEWISEWPSSALDKIMGKWTEWTGTEEAMRESAGDFRRSDRSSS